MGPHEMQSFCKAKDTVNMTKRLPTDLERIFTYPKSYRGLISNIYKELKSWTPEIKITPLINGVQSVTKNSQLRNTEWLKST